MNRRGNQPKAVEKSPFLTTRELAEYLRVSRQLIEKNSFRISGSCKVGRTRRYDLRKIEDNLRIFGTIFKSQEKRD
jgi:hypothetical protein